MSDNDKPISGNINELRLILCEGQADASFIKHLIEERKLPGFDVFFPREPYTETGGVRGFKEMLEAFSIFHGFGTLRGMLIVSDNDDNPVNAFRSVSEAISSAEGYKAPNQPLEVVRTNAVPPLVVVMLPWKDQPGNLETLCLTSSYESYPTIRACLDQYVTCTGVNRWGLTKQSKMRMRCMLSSTCSNDPNTSLVHAWSRPEDLIPLNHPCFDQLAEFLQTFDDYITRS
jgi:hypothetical protein